MSNFIQDVQKVKYLMWYEFNINMEVNEFLRIDVIWYEFDIDILSQIYFLIKLNDSFLSLTTNNFCQRMTYLKNQKQE